MMIWQQKHKTGVVCLLFDTEYVVRNYLTDSRLVAVIAPMIKCQERLGDEFEAAIFDDLDSLYEN